MCPGTLSRAAAVPLLKNTEVSSASGTLPSKESRPTRTCWNCGGNVADTISCVKRSYFVPSRSKTGSERWGLSEEAKVLVFKDNSYYGETGPKDGRGKGIRSNQRCLWAVSTEDIQDVGDSNKPYRQSCSFLHCWVSQFSALCPAELSLQQQREQPPTPPFAPKESCCLGSCEGGRESAVGSVCCRQSCLVQPMSCNPLSLCPSWAVGRTCAKGRAVLLSYFSFPCS